MLPGNEKLGDNTYVKQYIRGIYNLDPPRTRYTTIWDTSTVIEVLKHSPWVPTSEISLLNLSKKLIFLILVVSGKRGQLITALDIEKMELSEDKVMFKVDNECFKEGRPGYRPGLVTLQAFHDKDLCPVTLLQEYLTRTTSLRKSTKLFITTNKPHRPGSRDTVSRWVKALLDAAGINTAEFAAGSTRSAAGSKASQRGVPLDEIMAAGGWARPTTFSRWYKKEIRKKGSVTEAILGD